MKVEVISPQKGPIGATKRVVRSEDGRYFCVSGVDALLTGWEVLVFPCDEKGEVMSWGEVVGGRGITHEEAILMLEKWLDNSETEEIYS